MSISLLTNTLGKSLACPLYRCNGIFSRRTGGGVSGSISPSICDSNPPKGGLRGQGGFEQRLFLGFCRLVGAPLGRLGRNRDIAYAGNAR